jgi:hypothetical protein
VYKGVRYEEMRTGRLRGLAQNGGHIAAVDVASNRELWIVRVYETIYRPDMETDKQDVYITRLSLDRNGNLLLVNNERGERYAVSLKDRSIQKLPK